MSSRRLLSSHVVGISLVILAVLIVVFLTPRSKRAPEVTKEPETALPPQLAAGKQLYGHYCAQCHGETGDGRGPAAQYLYPKPRNFREGKFRIVTTANRVPHDEDLMHVIDGGMPGSGMFPFSHLSETERRELVRYVRHLTRSGIEERFRQIAAEFGDEVDPTELARDVERWTKPGDPIQLPSNLPPRNAQSIARAREIYLEQCATCHGETGKGDGVEKQFDDDGTPTRPRDYTRGIFKGGREREQLYARIRLGMPGTPMPEYMNLQPAQIGDLVNFIDSLSDPSANTVVEHKRRRLVAPRSAARLPDLIPDSLWEPAAPIPIVVSPLWWRDYAEPDLHVQAVHDGQSLAIRLTWQDSTRNDQTVRPQDFEDMAAVQLFQGEREPFLGMGATDGSVEVWLWHSSWQADLAHYADVDTTYPDMAVDIYPFEKALAGPRVHATKNQPREFLTAAAVGNPRSDPERATAASGLEAKGFGTLTMLPRISQEVRASGTRSGSRWSVVLRRPLQASGESKVHYSPGDKLSIAFAIWDGAARDRDGQKLVSIWHDLELE